MAAWLQAQKAAVAGELRAVGEEKRAVHHAREEPQRAAKGARQQLERLQQVGMRRMQVRHTPPPLAAPIGTPVATTPRTQ